MRTCGIIKANRMTFIYSFHHFYLLRAVYHRQPFFFFVQNLQKSALMFGASGVYNGGIYGVKWG